MQAHYSQTTENQENKKILEATKGKKRKNYIQGNNNKNDD